MTDSNVSCAPALGPEHPAINLPEQASSLQSQTVGFTRDSSDLERLLSFMDLPFELRCMVYKRLRDNRHRNLEYQNPDSWTILHASVGPVFYPALLRVNKQINEEYSALALGEASLNITFELEPELEPGQISCPPLPDISEFVEIPEKVLSDVNFLVLCYATCVGFPLVDPFRCIHLTIDEFPGLKHFWLYTAISMCDVDSGSRATRNGPALFQEFVGWMQDASLELEYHVKEDDLDIDFVTDFKLTCPLFEPMPETFYDLDLPLRQGCSPAPDLPKWGYSVFKVVEPWMSPAESDFEYHGAKLRFSGVEYDICPLHPLEGEADNDVQPGWVANRGWSWVPTKFSALI